MENYIATYFPQNGDFFDHSSFDYSMQAQVLKISFTRRGSGYLGAVYSWGPTHMRENPTYEASKMFQRLSNLETMKRNNEPRADAAYLEHAHLTKLTSWK